MAFTDRAHGHGLRSITSAGRTGSCRTAAAADLSVVICSSCELSGHARSAAEADFLISVHDRLHHGGPQWAARAAAAAAS